MLDQVRAYKAVGDKLVVQRAALEQRKVYKESGMSMLPMSLMPFIQVPVALGMVSRLRTNTTSYAETVILYTVSIIIYT
jgi:membrane protein insertase Oxa1/YidC/SpoIIIJ